ncbi:MAG: asparagine synthase (glutamine-hydrolyzing) [Hyphomicrobiaceae bacterium]
MCGLTGFLDLTRSSSKGALEQTVRGMADSLVHRGPDEGGVWADEAAGIALGHRRLSIVDLTVAGRQPMRSASGRFVLSYNGEIYNADELRAELGSGHAWRGHSDTEVLAEAIAAWGLETAIAKSAGMFALAVFDRETRTLSLVRDRLGKKPLYYTRQGSLFMFGSELRALRAHPQFSAVIDRDALVGFVRRGHYLEPATVYAGVVQLEPGHILTIGPDGASRNAPYWALQSRIEDIRAKPFSGSPVEAVDMLSSLLTDAVQRRMVADVPVGAFLSGGYDSSTVVALMQTVSQQRVRSFSIGFSQDDYNEAPFAREVARHLKTDHTEFMVTPTETLDVIPGLPLIYDEPFADSSQIPTYLVSKLARGQVTVALSGDGGDELFAGYNRYTLGDAMRRRAGRLPLSARRWVASALASTQPQMLDRLARLIPGRHSPSYLGDKLHKLAGVLALDDVGVYRQLTSQWPDDPAGVVIGGKEAIWPVANDALAALLPETIERMQYYDTLGYLPGDILAKVDRASMAVSLEVRAPLLDHRVAEFAWSLPLDLKIRKGQAKWVLRQVLYRHVPASLVDRPKAGFSVPVGDWLRTDLRDWAEDLLDEAKLREAGFFNPVPIRKLWADHQSGVRNGQYALWSILMFEAWRRVYHPSAT